MTCVRRLFATAGLLVVVALGVGSCDDSPNNTLVGRPSSSADAAELFPFSSLQDWVSYAQQVAVVRVDGIAPERRNSPGYTWYTTTVSLQVDETLWSDGPRRQAIEVETFGAWQRDEAGDLVPRSATQSLEPGRRYVVALTHEDEVSALLTQESILPLDGDVVAVHREAVPAARQLNRVTVLQLTSLLAATPPDPVAERYSDLPATEQRVRVLQDPDSDG